MLYYNIRTLLGSSNSTTFQDFFQDFFKISMTLGLIAFALNIFKTSLVLGKLK